MNQFPVFLKSYMERRHIAVLVEKYINGTCTVAERVELLEWIGRSADDNDIRDALENAWRIYQPDRLMPEDISKRILTSVLSADYDDSAGDPVSSYIPPRRSNYFRILRYIAAASIVLLGVSVWWLLRSNSPGVPEKKEDKHIVSTQKGLRSIVDLPDGTHVWLNAGSRLEYGDDFGKKVRAVLLSGEAFFDVTHNAKVPFVIHTTSMDLKVLGTAFNVRAYPEEKSAEASLIRGSLEVSFPGRTGRNIILKPNEKVSVGSRGYYVLGDQKPSPGNDSIKIKDSKMPVVSSVTYQPTDSSIVETSWVSNRLVFRNKPFEDVAGDMSRWYNVAIEFENSSLKGKRFTGTFERENVEQALQWLSFSYRFSYRFDPSRNVYIIY